MRNIERINFWLCLIIWNHPNPFRLRIVKHLIAICTTFVGAVVKSKSFPHLTDEIIISQDILKEIHDMVWILMSWRDSLVGQNSRIIICMSGVQIPLPLMIFDHNEYSQDSLISWKIHHWIPYVKDPLELFLFMIKFWMDASAQKILDVKRDETLWGKPKHFVIHRFPSGKPFETHETWRIETSQ